MNNKNDLWQSLKWNEWKDTAKTVHLFTQIIGKIRLTLMPMQAEWGQVPLTLTSRGISSISMPADFGSIDIVFDFIDHELKIFGSNGTVKSFSLKEKSVAAFYKEVFKSLNEIGVNIEINPMSVEMKVAVKMDEDEENKTYEENAVNKWWLIMIGIGNVFNKFRSKYSGKETPVNFWWGSFDLGITLFSGKFLKTNPDFDLIYRVAMDAEQSTVGFWPGNDESPEPIFFAYTYPKPDGFENCKLNPAEANWSEEKGEFILSYEFVRSQPDPGKVLMEFCESAFSTGVKMAGWDRETLEHKPPVEKIKI